MKNRGFRVETLEPQQIRKTAEELRCYFKLGIQHIDIVNFIEHDLFDHGVNLEIVEPFDLPNDEARSDPLEQAIFVRVGVYEDARRKIGRARFTLAHEVGHLALMHRALPAKSIANIWHYTEDSEWQADVFAAEFLAPVEGIKRYCKHPRDVSNKYGLSLEASGIRWRILRKDGLIK